MIKILKFNVIFFLFFLFFSCGKNHEKKLYILTTTQMIKDAVENIVGDKFEVISLMGSGVDPHLYTPTYGDLEKIKNAQIVFYNGLHLEGKMSRIFEKLENEKKIYNISKKISTKMLLKLNAELYDPHIWFSIKIWKNATEEIKNKLCENFPEYKNDFSEKFNLFKVQLDSLDNWAYNEISKIPQNKRVLITSHDAFGYFSRDYNIENYGLQGISTISSYGLNDLSKLVDIIIKREIRTIFFETSVNPKGIQAIQSACASKNFKVDLSEPLFSDSMGNSGTPEGTFVGMFKHNVNLIIKGLSK